MKIEELDKLIDPAEKATTIIIPVSRRLPPMGGFPETTGVFGVPCFPFTPRPRLAIPPLTTPGRRYDPDSHLGATEL